MMKKIWQKRMAFALAGLMSFGASGLLTAASVQAASAPAYYQNEQQVKDKKAPEAKALAEDTKAPQPEKKASKKKSSTSSTVTNAITTAAIASALAKGL